MWIWQLKLRLVWLGNVFPTISCPTLVILCELSAHDRRGTNVLSCCCSSSALRFQRRFLLYWVVRSGCFELPVAFVSSGTPILLWPLTSKRQDCSHSCCSLNVFFFFGPSDGLSLIDRQFWNCRLVPTTRPHSKSHKCPLSPPPMLVYLPKHLELQPREWLISCVC